MSCFMNENNSSNFNNTYDDCFYIQNGENETMIIIEYPVLLVPCLDSILRNSSFSTLISRGSSSEHCRKKLLYIIPYKPAQLRSIGETKGGSFVLSVINLLAEWLYKCNIRGSNLDREKETDRPYSINSLLDQRLVGWESFNGKWAMLRSVTGRPKSRARRKLHSPTNVVKCCQKLPRNLCGTNRQRNEWKKHNYCE